MYYYGHWDAYMELAGQIFWFGLLILLWFKRKTWLAPDPDKKD